MIFGVRAEDILRSILSIGTFGLFVWLIVWSGRRHRVPAIEVTDEPADTPYRIYTRQHDRVMRARDVPDFAQAIDKKRGRGDREGYVPWPKRIKSANRLASADCSDASRNLKPAFAERGGQIALSLLIDHSGSMRDSMVPVAAAIRWFADLAAEHGIALSVQGFTTVDWQGGESRREWLAAGRRSRPGRLCELLHIVYQDFGEPLAEQDWQAMLDMRVLRENVDGEALHWAAERLTARPEPMKVLIILSDGASVDDSTLAANGPSYLERHLLSVISDLEARADMQLGAVGICHAVDRYYRVSRGVDDLATLPQAMADLTVQLIVDA